MSLLIINKDTILLIMNNIHYIIIKTAYKLA